MVSRLERVSAAIAEHVGVDACAITLMGRPVDGSNVLVGDLEDWQFVLAEGPSVACQKSGRPHELGDAVSIADAYPMLAEHVVRAGIQAIAVVPIMYESHCLGTVALYSATPRRLAPDERRRAERWADHLTGIVLADVTVCAAWRENVTTNFDVATGCVMVSSDVDAATASTMIRAHAYADATPLRSLCRDIVDDGLVLHVP